MKLFILVIATFIYQNTFAAEWLCTEASSMAEGDTFYACGVGRSRNLAVARRSALKSAKAEFEDICSQSVNCRDKEVVVTPLRTSCEKKKSYYNCFRGFKYKVTDEKRSVVFYDEGKLEDDLAAKEAELSSLKKGYQKRQRLKYLNEEIKLKKLQLQRAREKDVKKQEALDEEIKESEEMLAELSEKLPEDYIEKKRRLHYRPIWNVYWGYLGMSSIPVLGESNTTYSVTDMAISRTIKSFHSRVGLSFSYYFDFLSDATLDLDILGPENTISQSLPDGLSYLDYGIFYEKGFRSIFLKAEVGNQSLSYDEFYYSYPNSTYSDSSIGNEVKIPKSESRVYIGAAIKYEMMPTEYDWKKGTASIPIITEFRLRKYLDASPIGWALVFGMGMSFW